MRFLSPLLCLLMAFTSNIFAEGTRELAPNGNITIGANTTTDLAALHINHPEYNNFASYTNDDTHSRLYIHVADPSKECVFLGFSFGHLNVTSPNPTRVNFEYRIKDPAGNIVFGPVTILSNAANIQNWSEAFTGPMQINGAGGYDAHEVTAANLTSAGWTGAGDYYIEFQSAGDADLLIDFWDITVADCTTQTPTPKTGRIWSYNWSIFAVNDFGFPNRPFNGAFYVCAPDPDDVDKAFITRIDFNGSGFRPAAFNIAFNSFGSMNTGNVEEDRKSVQLLNSTQSEYAIFLNDPVELCETAVVGEIILHGISRCDSNDYCIKFTTSKEGQVDLLLDFDGQDDVFTPGTADILISHTVTADETGIATCISWDGLDGLGNPVPEVAGTQIPVTISYAQGIYHFPIYDAEFMTSGFSLQAIRPAASIPLLYYDDSDIDVLSGSGEPPVQLSGCAVPCHRWTTFVNNTVPGFGNLNTINSWWFSQRIVRQDLLLLPGYFTCEISGPQSICQGSTTQITMNPILHPATVEAPQIISTIWTGPGIIGSNSGSAITIGAEGDYHVETTWVTALGDTCQTSCDYSLVVNPPLTETIDTLIVQGDVIVINGEQITEAGQYIQDLTNSIGCDSILTINVLVIQSVVHYDLDACISFMSDGSHMDYSEFTAAYPEPLSCAALSATIVHRENPQMQKHSCTPGVNNSVAMCISSLDACTYDAGNDASLVFELSVTPDPDTSVRITGLTFFEKAPVIYNWISGDSGPNNFPTRYGLRILKNGVEIYRLENIPTTNNWTLQSYEFLNDDDFLVEDPATFRFELLPYCLVGNGALVAAWDIDEISVTASCAPFEGFDQIITGLVRTPAGDALNDAKIKLQENFNGVKTSIQHTNSEGYYSFEPVREGSECTLLAEKNGNYLNGVSTLDLIYIQKHLLGIAPFNSPYQFVAADANRSNNVSAKDIIDLRKLILGYYSELPNNTSWRLGTADEINHGGYKWGFKETIDIEQLQYDYNHAHFTAVKIGDLNGNASTSFNAKVINDRSEDVLELAFQNHFIASSQTVEINIMAQDFYELAGLQFALALDGISINTIKSGTLTIQDENYLINGAEFSFSWNSTSGINVNAGDILFTLVLNAVSEGNVSEMLELNEGRLSAEAYSGAFKKYSIQLSGFDNHPTTQNRLFQNQPNPFTNETTIRFDLERSGVVTIRIMDLSGKIVREITEHRERGMNSLQITGLNTEVNECILLCQLQSDMFIETIKMVQLK